MSEIADFKIEIEKLKVRNKIVDANKAWEISLARKLLIMILTYIVASITLILLNNSRAFQNALIPSIGFFLSTLTITPVKNLWIKYIYKK